MLIESTRDASAAEEISPEKKRAFLYRENNFYKFPIFMTRLDIYQKKMFSNLAIYVREEEASDFVANFFLALSTRLTFQASQTSKKFSNHQWAENKTG